MAAWTKVTPCPSIPSHYPWSGLENSPGGKARHGY